jgi:predicted O-methyltransferase YrrM
MIENTFPAALFEDVRQALVREPDSTFAIVGFTPAALELVSLFYSAKQEDRLLGVFDEAINESGSKKYAHPLATLRDREPNFVVLAVDAEKQDLLERLDGMLPAKTKVLFAGSAHYDFRDPLFQKVRDSAHVPSLATGYPHTLTHIYQCLRNAERLGLEGVVVEFGMFKGGTTVLMARLIQALGQAWRVIGFDTFAGFPPKRSLFDMYDHPDCAFHDLESVRRYTEGHDIEIVPGDIVETIGRLNDEKIVLAFMDTDNFTPATTALRVIQDRVVVGGAIVFDHYTGRKRHRYTLGERIAARPLENDMRYFNLHDTGVFLRQR